MRDVIVATFKKFQSDRSARIAASIAFWAFFAVLPLFLMLVSVLGYVLPGSTRARVLDNVAALFPLLDPGTTRHLGGSFWAVAVGAATALWSGTQLMRTAEYAFNSAWEVPPAERPGFVGQMRRALVALLTIGTGLVLSALLTGFVTGQSSGIHLGVVGRVLGTLLSAALDVALFLLAFRTLTSRAVSFRDVLPGAVLSGLAFWLLGELSSLIIARRLQGAEPTYGHFATVITILWWFYIQSIVTMVGAELNVVLWRRAHPVGQTGAVHPGAATSVG